ncbi:FAD-dependent oxidoreductase [Sphingorhabdus sp. YGSMI21]|uniref:NAD(P)/FAD-dependent oxidoreductase n=1 Tax=Sphingorhabdus sp. YGSMI21 TaxID=2077182 RepID=UPI000C1E1C28|nr:FAD-dependent oxidoreductase [Sphingorhabdus sp. YGSMI21]ATW05270.1 hypothetical protein CHN51_18355 [Sphingorhabdus sp. YGSMI21]
MIYPVCIVGGALAGGSAALALRQSGYDGELILVSDESDANYDRPSLSKTVLSGQVDAPPHLFEPDWIAANRIEFLSSQRATKLDIHSGELSLSSGKTIRMGKVLLCTGSRPRLPALPGINLPGVCALRSDQDSFSIRSSVVSGSEVVIIGGGLIGCEVATSLAKLDCNVTVVESAPGLLLRVLGSEVGAWMQTRLEQLGVRVVLRGEIAAIEGTSGVEGVRLVSGQRLPAGLVLVAIGAEPNAELAQQAGLDCSGGILVDASGATENGMVFAAGDAASWPVRGGGQRSLETYLNSQAQAQIAAAAMLGESISAAQVPYSWTEIAGHRLQMAGDIVGPGAIHYRGQLDEGCALVFRILKGNVEAVIAVDSPADFGVAKRMVDEQSALLTDELVDPKIRLRDIHKKSREVIQ